MTKREQEEQTRKVHDEFAVALVDGIHARLEQADAMRELLLAIKAKTKQESKSQT